MPGPRPGTTSSPGRTAKAHLGRKRSSSRPGPVAAFSLVEIAIDNLHAALAWAAGQTSAESSLALCTALGPYWLMRSGSTDALHWIDKALSLPGAAAHADLHA